ncbi:MAG: leukotoxin LktA family filamentous adhesin, partial [Burkholderiales bacterium]
MGTVLGAGNIEGKRNSMQGRGRNAAEDLPSRFPNFTRFRLTPIALALGTAMGFPVATYAQQIVVDGRTNTALSVNGNVTDVTTSTLVGNNAFNSFSKFDVNAGNTVNLHVPTGAANLLNLINSPGASHIDGMLNTVKNGQIGGNVFLANPEGIIVGSSGVINAGSLTLLTPVHAFVDDFFQNGTPNAVSVREMLAGTVALNPSGLIRVQGKINVSGDAALLGGSVNVSGVVQSGALFAHTQVDFSDVVNTTDIQTGNAIIVQNGKIQIVASGDAVISGTVANNGGNHLKAGNVEIRAGHDVQLNNGALISASGRGESSSGGGILARAVNDLIVQAGTQVRADGGNISGDGGALVLSAGHTLTLSGGAFSAFATDGIAGSILIAPEQLRIEEDLLRTGSGNSMVRDGITWNAGSIALEADQSVTVTAGRLISSRQVVAAPNQSQRDAHLNNASTGDSGNITLSAKKIVLESGSSLRADANAGYTAGDITLNAADSAADLFFKSLENQDASIDIHGAILKGRNISLNANANDVFQYTGNDIADVFLKQLDNAAFLVDVSISQATARITVDGGALLSAAKDVNITANAKAEAAMNVMGEFGFGFGYGKASASATAEVLDAKIDAKQAVSISAAGDAKTDISVATINRGRDKNPLPVDASQYIDLALALSEGQLDSKAVIAGPSTVNAGGPVSVVAKGIKNASVAAKGGAYDDGTAGAGLAFS